MAREVYYPPVGFHFRVEFELPGTDPKDTCFQEVSGLNVEKETMAVRSGGDWYTYKLPTITTYSNLVLKRGMMIDSSLIKWCKENIESLDEIEPISVFVTLLNEQHEPIQTFHVVHAWPLKWSVSNFNAQENSIVIESLELTYKYFKEVI